MAVKHHSQRVVSAESSGGAEPSLTVELDPAPFFILRSASLSAFLGLCRYNPAVKVRHLSAASLLAREVEAESVGRTGSSELITGM